MENKTVIKYLSEFITKQRFNKFKQILKNRTNYISVVLEEVFQAHNASAILRTCDCFGVQNVYVIKNRNEFKPNPGISMGAAKWLTINFGQNNPANIQETIINLKNKGYRIIATTPHKNSILLNDFDISKGKFALLFGTELSGLSNEAMALADEFVKIPMYGFTESFNVSVSVGIFLSNTVEKLKKSNIKWQISDSEKEIQNN